MKRSRATRLGRAGLLLPMLLATACAAVPNLGAKPMPAAAGDYASTRSLSGADSAWPSDGWWTGYGDAQLDGLMAQGVAGSPDLAAAVARFRTAQGLAQQAGAALLPSLDASASVDYENQSQNIGGPGVRVPGGWHATGTAGLSLNFDLDLFGKNRAALRAANRRTTPGDPIQARSSAARTASSSARRSAGRTRTYSVAAPRARACPGRAGTPRGSCRSAAPGSAS